MSERIHDFLRRRRDEGLDDGPCLIVDLDIVRENYRAFAKALPDSRIFYAVKANPAPELLASLVSLGSCFDTASVAEIEMVLAAGATPERISFGNTIKKERDIARAHALGVRLFAVDCKAEVEKIARAAPGAKVFCRFLFAVPAVVPRRFAAAQDRRVGRSAQVGGGDLSRLRRPRHQPVDGQSRRRLPHQVPAGGAGGRSPRPCAAARTGALRRVIPCRLAAAPHGGLG